MKSFNLVNSDMPDMSRTCPFCPPGIISATRTKRGITPL